MKENGHLETSESEVREAIKDCAICRAYNPSRDRGYRHVPAYEVGEKVAIDIIEPRDHTYIVTAIDYFSRQGFARVLKNKEAKGLLKFIQDIHKVLKIKTLITDDARENCSAEIKAWLEKQGITHHITSPYHHESNGRVKRFNRTVQEGLNKAKVRGTLVFRLGKVIEVYNTIRHEALDMSPNQAAQPENWEKVKQK
ncbi:hypothetical protein PAPHI01_2674 [Pancytospora philotis]|nr:hypothetical protein PAPHI01_2674 [Pancytospora philotis]